MGMKKKYWTGIDELHGTAAAQQALTQEFTKDQTVEDFLSDGKLKDTNTGRRDFLKFMGFSVAAASLAACETPVVKSIPYVVKPEEITPGVANFYASTYYDGNDYGNILVKSREGRPIFIKGNKDFGLGGGAVSSRINSSVLGLYDNARVSKPRKQGNDINWSDLDNEVKAALQAAQSIRIVSNTIISPSTHRAINEFSAKYAGKVKHIQYDAVSYNGLSKAHDGAVPSYNFDKAKTIVSIGADFLGTWLTPNIFSTQYASTRKPEGKWMSKHFQFESSMSLSGSNADVRTPIKPSQEGMVAAALYAAVTGGSTVSVSDADAAINNAAAELKASRGESIVVAGSNDPMVQTIVKGINQALGNYANCIDANKGTNFFKGNDEEMKKLVEEMNAGSVGALIIYGCNPAYSWYEADKFMLGLQKVPCSVSFSLFADETANKCTYIAPDHHYLESWNDLSPMAGRTDLVQPIINPLHMTRYAQESLLRWADNNANYYDYLRSTYNGAYTPAMMKSDSSWHMAVHNGTFATNAVVADAPAQADAPQVVSAAAPVMAAAPLNVNDAVSYVSAIKGGQFELSLYEKVTMGNGIHANNPLLNETPDPITKVTWDNYACMAIADMTEMGLQTYIGQCDCASKVKVTVDGKSVIVPAFPTPGQKRGTISIALGYGRGAGNEEIGNAAYQTGEKGTHLTDKDGNRVPVGQNVYNLANISGNTAIYAAYNVSVEKLDETYPLATTQMHNTVMGRDSIVRETTIAAYIAEKTKAKGSATWNMAHTLAVHEDVNKDGKINIKDQKDINDFDLWREHPVEGVGHRWGLTIDLNSCIGCGSCITACHTENNVPVVGKDEVLRHRDMHWLRIDRYFSSEYNTVEETAEANKVGTIGAYRLMENPEENPKTVHMPMMCQHCNHAPCETVCPVAATVHSNEGLNNMAYNRCIGTRYCANNCPYKVRRFNWFNYVTNDKFAMVNPSQDESMRMVLNPDVTVRTRGVMEKCSMCQQRIQAGKLDAKKAGTPVADGSILTACAEACPTNAIVFGDLNDAKSTNRKRADDVRSYHSLEETGVKPNVYYMTKVRNIEETEA